MRPTGRRTIDCLISVCCLILYVILTDMLLVYLDSHLALEEVAPEVGYGALKVVVQVVAHIVHAEVDVLLPNQEEDMGEVYNSHWDTWM